MQKLIGNAKLLTKDISLLIKKVINACGTCIKFRKTNLRPVVTFTKSEDFKQTVSVDLYQISANLWYMHFVDGFTWYGAALFVRNKDVYHEAFIKDWISTFGTPKNPFQVFIFQFYFNKKYVEAAINDFTMHLIVLK